MFSLFFQHINRINIFISASSFSSINKFYPISQIYFSKPLICKQNQDYCILLNSKKSTNAYYGRQGKSFVEGEKGVDFTFKRIPGRLSKTSVEVGNFPELYYYIN